MSILQVCTQPEPLTATLKRYSPFRPLGPLRTRVSTNDFRFCNEKGFRNGFRNDFSFNYQ